MLDKMIDIHCHILPGIDDGPDSFDESIMMVKQAVNQGISKIIATPHFPFDKFIFSKEDVFEKVNILQEKIDAIGLKCKIYPGMELYLSSEIIEKIVAGEVIPLGKDSNYLLVEFPLRGFSKNLINLLHETWIRGYIPIVAHPERYEFILNDPLMINEILEYQTLLQINAGSILGKNGQRSQKLAIELIKQGLVSFIASDGHSTNWRKIQLSDALATLMKNVNPDLLRNLVVVNGTKLLNNKEISKPVGEYNPKKQNIFRLFITASGFK